MWTSEQHLATILHTSTMGTTWGRPNLPGTTKASDHHRQPRRESEQTQSVAGASSHRPVCLPPMTVCTGSAGGVAATETVHQPGPPSVGQGVCFQLGPGDALYPRSPAYLGNADGSGRVCNSSARPTVRDGMRAPGRPPLVHLAPGTGAGGDADAESSPRSNVSSAPSNRAVAWGHQYAGPGRADRAIRNTTLRRAVEARCSTGAGGDRVQHIAEPDSDEFHTPRSREWGRA